jgi:phosphoribosyl 1,2-cyclic phosphate phosphodiesterase
MDTSTDLRQQALANKIPRVDAVLYTHPHADHIHGIDDLRSFNFIQKEVIPVFGNEWTTRELEERFGYVFGSGGIYEGGGRPMLELRRITKTDRPFNYKGLKIQPIPLSHGSMECLAYRIGSVAYATDCSYIPPQSLELLQGLSVLVLDCLQLAPHRTHLNLDQALEIVSQVKPRRTVFTHLGHDFDYTAWSRKLPKGTELAYDGMKIRFNAGE